MNHDKKNKVEGKGAGRGKGKDKVGRGASSPSASAEGSTAYSRPGKRAARALESHRKLLLRLDNHRRSQNKEQQLVIEVEPASEYMRNQLEHVMAVWKRDRPEAGRHPDGDLHELCWKMLLST